ncbi:hypothetical protein STSP2_00332 [Anaerohalosphaera lusitana]|uniref:Uncharacterized protein n=1 Tax=Anaerohalosphaera lusitana TaxID=1936003 RepID=A0A1U9NGY9_9BACT|nr:hypothetical protein STSP2_00332 [Anaerohalosphaera lusitana]
MRTQHKHTLCHPGPRAGIQRTLRARMHAQKHFSTTCNATASIAPHRTHTKSCHYEERSDPATSTRCLSSAEGGPRDHHEHTCTHKTLLHNLQRHRIHSVPSNPHTKSCHCDQRSDTTISNAQKSWHAHNKHNRPSDKVVIRLRRTQHKTNRSLPPSSRTPIRDPA